ncbi:MAG: SUMF1/EgtB/PvdO family nonheme iron enzyme [Bacteroidota bacterium]
MRFLLMGIWLISWQLTLAYPDPFVDVMRARHDGDYYDRQAAEWELEATGDCGTEDAWWNYCKTAHYSNLFGSGDYEVLAIIERAKPELDPAGFVYNYLHYAFVNTLDQEQRWQHLLTAHEVAPERYEAYPGLAGYYEVHGMFSDRNRVLRAMHQAEPIPAGVMDYNFNQLAGIPANSLLITTGDADTYPSWLLQYDYSLRPDVMVVNLSLLENYPTYREIVFEKLKLEEHELLAAPSVSSAEVLAALAEQQRPIALAVTAQHLIPQLNPEHLFLIGLAFQYSQQAVNNLQELHANYQHRWRMERLRQPLADDPGQRVADGLNQNYLPALIELHEHYQSTGHPQTMDLRAVALRVAERAGVAENVRTYLDGPTITLPRLASTSPGIRARQIERSFVRIPLGSIIHLDEQRIASSKSFSMQETEVSNADYQLFLEDLLRQRLFRHIDTASMGEVNWLSLLPDSLADWPVAELYKMGTPTADRNPVLNISHRAAELYAQWLTEVYNQDSRRRDGRNVRFRLPTRIEWVYAAAGGRNNVPYPWGGPYYRNAKGCYLSNFNSLLPQDVSLEARQRFIESMAETPADRALSFEELDRKRQAENCDDGGWLTVPVDAYFPNDYGLYQMSGNAAEMLAEEGQTVGGSWMDPAHFMQIDWLEERSLPHPSTGFRLVMEYLD